MFNDLLNFIYFLHSLTSKFSCIFKANTKYNWSGSTQGVILGAYFWGYVGTSLLGGPMSERWGPRLVVGVSSAGAALLTLLSPLAADLHHWALVVCRLLIGAFGVSAANVLYK